MSDRLSGLLSVALVCLTGALAEAGELVGDWRGEIVNGGRALSIVVHFKLEETGLNATIDIPQRRAKGVKLSNVVVTEDVVHFEIRARSRAIFHGKRQGDVIKGRFIQGRVRSEFSLRRVLRPDEETWPTLLPKFKALPGSCELTVMKLSDPVVTVATVHSGTPRAVASSGQLYMLGALLEDLKAGKRTWSDQVTLNKQARSLPSGVLQDWPLGTPLTVQSLVTFMLAHDDNTAADHLLQLLGRGRVEEALTSFGNTQAKARPYLATYELFFLKSQNHKALLKRYQGASLEQRRTLLAELSSLDRGAVKFPSQPTAIDGVEWFASTSELCLLLNELRRLSEDESRSVVRRILSMRASAGFDRKLWPYVGLKTGSEPGVFNMCLLLKRRDKLWFAVAVTVNNSRQVIQKRAIGELMKRVLVVLSKTK